MDDALHSMVQLFQTPEGLNVNALKREWRHESGFCVRCVLMKHEFTTNCV
jgi:hypothetical protein